MRLIRPHWQKKLKTGEIDLGLVPVAIISQLPQFYINGNYCIGAVGDVASVALFSQVPIEQIRTIYLDYQSRSSVQLLKWLVKNHWKIDPELIDAKDESYLSYIKNDTAAVIIGDRALAQRSNFRYIYDLAGEWKIATGLPFVFAAWVSTKSYQNILLKNLMRLTLTGFSILMKSQPSMTMAFMISKSTFRKI
ncbi:hypothetical protein LWM68_03725 [Niabella sp. W65]|nr:hypothetical protein [Niabella sp. W65]MCH7361967.1 hypothetical protein [Niabella sp. W65]